MDHSKELSNERKELQAKLVSLEKQIVMIAGHVDRSLSKSHANNDIQEMQDGNSNQICRNMFLLL